MKKIIIILFTSLLFFSCSDSQEVKMVKNGILNSYPNKTLGQLVEGFVGDPKWESIKDDKGDKYVNITGTIKYYERDTKIILQYKINGNTFELNAIEFNDVPQNFFVYEALIEKMYMESN